MKKISIINYQLSILIAATLFLASCGEKQPADGANADAPALDDTEAAVDAPLPFSSDKVSERVVIDFGKRTVRTQPDKTISQPELVKQREKCFILMSKKDYYLYVYEDQGTDTVLIARYDVCYSLHKGQKERSGDMRTPHCTMQDPFHITQIQDAAGWNHDFGDGRGSIPSYGAYFLRLHTPGLSGIGIHGSTNNEQSVPGRASEGCIRLRDKDIIDLQRNYAFQGMNVVIKDETQDDLPFERRAMRRQHIQRLRHIDPARSLTNEQIQSVPATTDRVARPTERQAERSEATEKEQATEKKAEKTTEQKKEKGQE